MINDKEGLNEFSDNDELIFDDEDEEFDDEDERPVLQLVGLDGNSFSILARARATLKKHGYDKQEIEKVTEEATAADYDNLLQVMMKYFNVR